MISGRNLVDVWLKEVLLGAFAHELQAFVIHVVPGLARLECPSAPPLSPLQLGPDDPLLR